MSSAGSSYVAYNPDDSTITSFLSALALGETGNSPNAANEGFGGVSLAGDPTDSAGFPIQPVQNVSTAAGTYQFLRGTYDSIAGELGLDNSFSQNDQNEAAWYYAQQTYTAKTGGNFYDALASGDYQSVQNALSSVWPSVSGNASAPQGLAASLAGGQGANVPFPPLTAARVAAQPLVVAHLQRLREARLAFLATLKTGLKGSA